MIERRRPDLNRVLVRSSARTPQQGAVYRVAADHAESISVEEGTAILGIAWGMAMVGGTSTADERAFYDTLVEWAAARIDREAMLEAAERVKILSGSLEDLVRIHASQLSRLGVREIAYKAAYLLRLWDLESNPEEEAYDALLLDVLDLEDMAEELAGEVDALLFESG